MSRIFMVHCLEPITDIYLTCLIAGVGHLFKTVLLSQY